MVPSGGPDHRNQPSLDMSLGLSHDPFRASRWIRSGIRLAFQGCWCLFTDISTGGSLRSSCRGRCHGTFGFQVHSNWIKYYLRSSVLWRASLWSWSGFGLALKGYCFQSIGMSSGGWYQSSYKGQFCSTLEFQLHLSWIQSDICSSVGQNFLFSLL